MTEPEKRTGADRLLDYIQQNHPDVAALIASQSGPLNGQVAELVARGWTVESVEYVEGKRVRILTPPPSPSALPAPSYKTAQCQRCGGALDTSYGEWQHSDSGYVGCGPDGNGPGFAEPVDEQDGGRSDG